MSGFRAYFENVKSLRQNDEFFLSLEESRHLCGALRAKASELVDVFDMSGEVAHSQILSSSSKSAKLKVLDKSLVKKSETQIVLAQALPKGKTFDDIIAICVQIGVSKIIPIIAEHCVVKLDASDAKKKHIKWRQQLIESVKQSANMQAVEITELMSYDEFLNYSKIFESENVAKFVASLEAENPPPILSALKANSQKSGACVLIGCEGDFSKSEYKKAYENNFEPVSLGDNVLKSDIAAAFSMSVCSAFFADKYSV